jgi:uncharacterized RDD family membrane protein YckC
VTEERSLLEGSHSVLTPEYVEFDFVLAGLFSRFLAWLIDTLITFTLAFALLIAMSLAMFAFPGFASALGFVLWFAIDWGYAILLESIWSGQTVGKKTMGLRVIQESGVRIGFLHAVLRNLARPIDRLPFLYAVGGTAALFSKSQQRLGDMLAGTIVVRDRRLKIPASIARPDGETALLEDPLFRSRIAKLSAEEEALIFSAALRREEMGMEARLSLFAALSLRLQDDADVYKPPHLSDEKLVLLCAAALAKRNSERSLGAGRKGRPRNMLQQRNLLQK